MTDSILNETFISSDEEDIVNENLLFNSSLLEECKIHAPRIEEELNKYGGTLINPELELFFIKKIHPVGKPLINQKTHKVDFPNGLQIRSNMITDSETVDKFKKVIESKRWDCRRDQIILILLPEEYQYTDSDGNKIIYGIIDGNHRIDGATSQLQECVIAWLIDMPLKKIRKYGNAVCNRDDNVVRDRADDDIVDSIVYDLIDETTDLHKQTKEAQKGEDQDKNNISVENVWRKEIDDYNVHHKKGEAILRKLKWAEHGFVVGRKPWDDARIKLFIKDNKTDCSGWVANTDKDSLYDYETKSGIKIIVCQAEGYNYLIAAFKYAKLVARDPNAIVEIYFALAKKDKPTQDTLPVLREKFKKRVFEVFDSFEIAQDNIFKTRISRLPRWAYFPENAKELEGKRFIYDR